MNATLTVHRTLTRPLYEIVIRRGPVELWRMTDRSEVKVYAEAQRAMARLEA